MRPKLLIGGLFISLIIQADAGLKSGQYFQAIATNQVIKNELWNLVDGKKQEIYATRILRSTDYAYDFAPTITFFGDRIDDDGNPIPEAIVNVPDGATRLLLLFAKLTAPNERGLSYRVIAMRDDSDNFKFGSFRFINTSQKEIAIKLAEERFLVDSSGSNTIEIEPPERGDLSIRIAVKDEDGVWNSCYTNGWGHRSNLRTLVFLVEEPDGRIKTMRFRQTEPRE